MLHIWHISSHFAFLEENRVITTFRYCIGYITLHTRRSVVFIKCFMFQSHTRMKELQLPHFICISTIMASLYLDTFELRFVEVSFVCQNISCCASDVNGNLKQEI